MTTAGAVEPTRTMMAVERWTETEETALAKKHRGAATPEGMEAVARRVAALRRERGITQEEMAGLIGVSQPVYSDYERGMLRLHAEVIVRLAKILRVSTDQLLGVERSRRNGNAPIRNRRLLRRLQQIDRLSRRDQDAVMRTIDAFLTAKAR